MDETLIHACASSDLCNYPEEPEYISSFIDNQGNSLEIGIFLRPGVYQFLKRISKHFQVLVFTASDQNYADYNIALKLNKGFLRI
eukprot:403370903